jgi:AcrR family transcriptional regulator
VTAATTKPLRADARRNYEALLAAGKAVFARSGTDAPLEDIAKEAGVGQGTLYRHFPSREHLFVAIIEDRVDFLDTKARELLDAPNAWQALTTWLRMYDQIATGYRGMSARVGDALIDDGSPVAAACAPMKASFDLLFDRARETGVVRSDVTAVQVLTMIAALPKDPENDGTIEPYLDIVLRGLRA